MIVIRFNGRVMNYLNDDLWIKEIKEFLFLVVLLEKFLVSNNVVEIVVKICVVIYNILCV